MQTLLALVVLAAARVSTPEWEDPAVFALGTEKARATFVPHATREEAMSFSNIKHPSPRTLPVSPTTTTRWVSIGHASRSPWTGPAGPSSCTSVACSRPTTSGSTGPDWAIGRTPSRREKFDVTPHLRRGINVVAVQVIHHSDGSYLEDKEGARLGIHSSRVVDLHFPHVMAQENGNRTDVRWVALTGSSGIGLRVSGVPTLNFTAHDYGDQALLAAKTSQRIVRDGGVTLSLDLQQMGLGGDDSWSPRVHPEYQLAAREYQFLFRMRGTDPVRRASLVAESSWHGSPLEDAPTVD